MFKLCLLLLLCKLSPSFGQEPSEILKGSTEGSSESFSRSMEDVLEENADLKYQVGLLINVITQNITQLSNLIQKNVDDIQKNVDGIQKNVDHIQKNVDDIQKNVDDIGSVSEEVSSARLDILDNTGHIGLVEGRVASNEAHISLTNLRIGENKAFITANSARLDKLSQRGAYCGYRDVWSTANSVITYNRLMLSEGDAGALVPATGVWTARVPGLFQINWSLFNRLIGDNDNWIFLYRNGEKVHESRHLSYIDKTTSSERVISEMGGRTMLLRLEAGETLTLRTTTFQGYASYIHFCVMLLAAGRDPVLLAAQ